MLSILFRNPNFLILDEPTNDLDLPTLGVLENFLLEFPGCLLIVSHDRYFMDRLVDHLLVFEGDGVIKDFPGNYSQYRIWQREQEAQTEVSKINSAKPKAVTETREIKEEKKRLSFKEKREFELLGQEISSLSKEKETITEKLNSGQLSYEELQELSRRINDINNLLDEKEFRWLELSEYAE